MVLRKLPILTATLMLARALNAQYLEDNYPPFCDDSRCASFYAEVDYLLWYANQDGLSYGTVAKATIPTIETVGLLSTPTLLNEKDQFFDNKWNSGVRGTIGIKPTCVSWDTSVSYTYYSTHLHPKSNSVTLDGQATGAGTPSVGTILLNDYLYNTIEQFAGITSFNNDPHWKLNFNQVDWELGREFLIGCDTVLRPFFGLRGLWTNQSFSGNTRTAYPNSDDDIPVVDVISFNNKSRFESVGARAGFDANFSLGCGFDFYGNLSGSILWGRFKVNQRYEHTDFYSTGAVVFLEDENFDHSHQGSIFNFDVGLGIKWNYWFNCNRHLFSLKFGWEQHFYTNMNQFQNFYLEQINTDFNSFTFDRNVQRGNLSLSGFIFGASLVY